MTHVVNIPDALSGRMALIAQAMAEHVNPGLWAGYTAAEGLVGRYTKPSSLGGAPTAEYHRPSDPSATMALGFLELVSIQEADHDPPLIIREGIGESHEFDVEFLHAIEYEETVEHTFERTTSLAEATAKAWEVSAKASLSVEYAGIKGALEVAGKYGETLNRQVSQGDMERDRVQRTLRFKGPATFRLRAERSLNRESRVIRARADFDGKIYWYNGETQWEFSSYRTQFLPIIRRTADDSIYGYQEFMDRPMSDEAIDAIEAPPNKLIEFVAEYDAIVSQSLKEIE